MTLSYEAVFARKYIMDLSNDITFGAMVPSSWRETEGEPSFVIFNIPPPSTFRKSCLICQEPFKVLCLGQVLCSNPSCWHAYAGPSLLPARPPLSPERHQRRLGYVKAHHARLQEIQKKRLKDIPR